MLSIDDWIIKSTLDLMVKDGILAIDKQADEDTVTVRYTYKGQTVYGEAFAKQ